MCVKSLPRLLLILAARLQVMRRGRDISSWGGQKEQESRHKKGSSMTRVPLTCCHASSLAFGASFGRYIIWRQPMLKQPRTAIAILEEKLHVSTLGRICSL